MDKAAWAPSSSCPDGIRTYDRELGPIVGHGRQERRPVADRGDDLVAEFGQEPDEPLTEQYRVLGDHDPHSEHRPNPCAHACRAGDDELTTQRFKAVTQPDESVRCDTARAVVANLEDQRLVHGLDPAP